MQSLKNRLMNKVRITDMCWEFIGCVGSNGYGKIWHKDKRGQYSAHRAMWELVISAIPKHLMVCHACDNPVCVNPSHLFLGTNQDNQLDAVKKGIVRGIKGEANSKAKLTAADVIQMRSIKDSQRNIARQFNISQSVVCGILNHKRWTNV